MAHYMLVAEGSESPSKQFQDDDSGASDNDSFLEKNLPLQPLKPFYHQHCRPIVLHSVLLTINLMIGLAIWHWASKQCPFGVYGPGLVYSKPISRRRAIAEDVIHSASARCHSVPCTNVGFHQCLFQERFSQPKPVAQGTWASFS